MTLRLNEAQDALLNPNSFKPTYRPTTPTAKPSPTRAPSASFQREWASPHKTRPVRKTRSNGEWMIVAIAAVAVIVVSTIVVLAFTYSGPIGFSVRVLPAILIALVWTTAGLQKPPMATFLLLGLGVLLWPLSAASVAPFSVFATAIPTPIWCIVTVAFVAMIVLRTASSRASWTRKPAAA